MSFLMYPEMFCFTVNTSTHRIENCIHQVISWALYRHRRVFYEASNLVTFVIQTTPCSQLRIHDLRNSFVIVDPAYILIWCRRA